jgi:hypothetical protein
MINFKWKDASAYYPITYGKNIPPLPLTHTVQREISRIESYELADALHACGILAELFHVTARAYL